MSTLAFKHVLIKPNKLKLTDKDGLSARDVLHQTPLQRILAMQQSYISWILFVAVAMSENEMNICCISGLL